MQPCSSSSDRCPRGSGDFLCALISFREKIIHRELRQNLAVNHERFADRKLSRAVHFIYDGFLRNVQHLRNRSLRDILATQLSIQVCQHCLSPHFPFLGNFHRHYIPR
nr:MAG TPA: hypothetical protein [Caudoviricetes sp.]